jgi:hypothetical protein
VILSRLQLSPNKSKFANTLNKSDEEAVENNGIYCEEPDFLLADNYTIMLPCHVLE